MPAEVGLEGQIQTMFPSESGKLRDAAVAAWREWWRENRRKLVKDPYTGLFKTKKRLEAERNGLIPCLEVVLDPAFKKRENVEAGCGGPGAP